MARSNAMARTDVGAQLLFSDDFSGDLTAYNLSDGDWAISNGELTSQAGGGVLWANTLMATNTSDFSNFDLRARIKKPTGNTQMIFRSGLTSASGYGIQIRDASTFRLEVYQGAFNKSTTPITWVTGNWYKVRVICIGRNIRCKVWNDTDAEPEAWNINYDHAQFLSGRIGFSTENQAGTFDDLFVYSVGRLSMAPGNRTSAGTRNAS